MIDVEEAKSAINAELDRMEKRRDVSREDLEKNITGELEDENSDHFEDIIRYLQETEVSDSPPWLDLGHEAMRLWNKSAYTDSAIEDDSAEEDYILGLGAAIEHQVYALLGRVLGCDGSDLAEAMEYYRCDGITKTMSVEELMALLAECRDRHRAE